MESNNYGNKLCEDLLVEILCRCDGKDISRFKCVSKSWYILISQVCIPRISGKEGHSIGLYFRTLASSDHIPGTLYSNSSKKAISQDKIISEYASLDDNMSSSTHKHLVGCRLLDSCNGLLLFVNKSICQYYVCNPLIKQCVPIPKATDHGPSFVYSALAFDPSQSIHYKVVRFTSFNSEPLLLLDIYSSNTGQWIRRSVQLQLQLDPCVSLSDYIWQNHSVYFSGVIYRISYSRHLLCLDLNAMNGHVIALPTVEDSGRRMGCIGIWTGCLCYSKSDMKSLVLIWSLENHSEAGFEWVLKYSFSIFDIMMQLVLNIKHPHADLLWFEPSAFCPYSDVIFFGTPRMILSYDLKSNRFEEVFRTKDGIRCYDPYLIVAPCLVSLTNAGLMHSRSAESKMIPEGMEVLQLEKPSNDGWHPIAMSDEHA